MEAALQIVEIVEQIISELHNEHCERCRKISLGIDVDFSGMFVDYNSKALFNCIMVSKLWSSIAIPKLWSEHAELHRLQHFLFNDKAVDFLMMQLSGGSVRYISMIPDNDS